MATEGQSQVENTRSTRARWLVATTLVLLALIGTAVVILAIYWPFSSSKVIAAVQEDWGGKIAVQRFRSTYFPHPGCILEGVALTHAAEASTPPIVTVQKLIIAANYHDLFLRPGYVSAVNLEGLKISIPTGPTSGASKSSSDNSFVRLGEVFTKDAVLEIEKKQGGWLRFDIRELRLNTVNKSDPTSYDLVLHNPEPPGDIRSKGKLGPLSKEHPENIALSGLYTFDHADLSAFHGIAGVLAAKGDFQGTLGKIQTQGTIEIPDFEVTHSKHTVELKTKYTAVVDGTTGDTLLRSVDATFLRTAVHAEGAVASKSGTPGRTTTLNLTVHEGRIDDVLRLFVRDTKPPMQGSTSFHAHVSFPSGPQPFLKRLTLQGDFTIAHAQWENAEKQAKLNMLSKRASGNKKDAATPSVTADINGNVTLTDAVGKLHDVSFKIPGAEATMSGTYNLENTKIDFHGTLKTDSSISDESTGAKAVLLKPLDPLFKRKNSGAVIPVEMTGTYSQAHLGVSLMPKK